MHSSSHPTSNSASPIYRQPHLRLCFFSIHLTTTLAQHNGALAPHHLHCTCCGLDLGSTACQRSWIHHDSTLSASILRRWLRRGSELRWSHIRATISRNSKGGSLRGRCRRQTLQRWWQSFRRSQQRRRRYLATDLDPGVIGPDSRMEDHRSPQDPELGILHHKARSRAGPFSAVDQRRLRNRTHLATRHGPRRTALYCQPYNPSQRLSTAQWLCGHLRCVVYR